LARDVTVEEGFGEHDPGPDCDGLTFVDFVDRYGAPDWESDPYGVTFPGGETVAEFDVRVGATLSQVIRRHPGGTIVVVCHGGVIDRIFRWGGGKPAGSFAIGPQVLEVGIAGTFCEDVEHLGVAWRMVKRRKLGAQGLGQTRQVGDGKGDVEFRHDSLTGCQWRQATLRRLPA